MPNLGCTEGEDLLGLPPSRQPSHAQNTVLHPSRPLLSSPGHQDRTSLKSFHFIGDLGEVSRAKRSIGEEMLW